MFTGRGVVRARCSGKHDIFLQRRVAAMAHKGLDGFGISTVVDGLHVSGVSLGIGKRDMDGFATTGAGIVSAYPRKWGF